MQVAIYEHLHLSWGSICLHNIGFVVVQVIMQVVIYEHLQVILYACIMFGFVVVQATVAVHSKYYASRHL